MPRRERDEDVSDQPSFIHGIPGGVAAVLCQYVVDEVRDEHRKQRCGKQLVDRLPRDAEHQGLEHDEEDDDVHHRVGDRHELGECAHP